MSKAREAVGEQLGVSRALGLSWSLVRARERSVLTCAGPPRRTPHHGRQSCPRQSSRWSCQQQTAPWWILSESMSEPEMCWTCRAQPIYVSGFGGDALHRLAHWLARGGAQPERPAGGAPGQRMMESAPFGAGTTRRAPAHWFLLLPAPPRKLHLWPNSWTCLVGYVPVLFH